MDINGRSREERVGERESVKKQLKNGHRSSFSARRLKYSHDLIDKKKYFKIVYVKNTFSRNKHSPKRIFHHCNDGLEK